MKKNCLVCQKEFYCLMQQIKRGGGKYCSRGCRDNARKNGKYNKCAYRDCNIIIYTKPNQQKIGKGKYCSKEHYSIELSILMKGKKPKNFEYFKTFCTNRLGSHMSQTDKDYLSNYNISIGKKPPIFSQEDHWNWQGGLTSLQERIRKCIKYKIWRETIFKRDNYICQNCGKVDSGNLNANHIKPFSIILIENKICSFEDAMLCKDLWDLNNGETLCVPCHQLTDSYLNSNIVKEYLYATN